MSTLICPVTRKIACDTLDNVEVLGELVNWSGVSLILHRPTSHGVILGGPQWSCSHERTGYRIASGPSPETALAVAIEKVRRNWETFHDQVRALPVINP